MYFDENRRYHVTDLPTTNLTQGVTHAVMAFAKSDTFNSGSAFTPFEPIETFRARFPADTKVMIAIGGWGDTSGFSAGAKDNTTRATYAKNVAAMLNSTGADGVGNDSCLSSALTFLSSTAICLTDLRCGA